MKQYLLLILMFSFITTSFSQEVEPLKEDLIVFEDGVKLSGKIKEVTNSTITILIGNNNVTIKKKHIKVIFYKGDKVSFIGDFMNLGGSDKQDQAFELVPKKETKKRGLYNITYGGIRLSEQGGMGIENVTGYQFNKYTGLGIGVGYEDIGFNSYYGRGKVVPVYLEYRGYLSDNKVSFYYTLAYGLNFGVDPTFGSGFNDGYTYKPERPGSYFHPAIGYKVGSGQSSFMIDLGFRMSSATYTSEVFTSFPGSPITLTNTATFEDTFNYQGVVLRLGVML